MKDDIIKQVLEKKRYKSFGSNEKTSIIEWQKDRGGHKFIRELIEEALSLQQEEFEKIIDGLKDTYEDAREKNHMAGVLQLMNESGINDKTKVLKIVIQSRITCLKELKEATQK